jgi:inhibitor of cysteine peptidase
MQSKKLDDDGGTAELRVGEILEIRLPELASAGYRWAIGDREDAVIGIEPAAGRQGGAIGSAGEAAFIVRAHQAGTARLGLKYWREWEGDRSIQRRFGLTIRVLD